MRMCAKFIGRNTSVNNTVKIPTSNQYNQINNAVHKLSLKRKKSSYVSSGHCIPVPDKIFPIGNVQISYDV